MSHTHAPRRRRATLVVLTVAGLLALSGCFKFDMGITVAEDETVSGAFIIAVDESMSEMMEEGQDSPFDISGMPDGATVEPYAADGKVGRKIVFDSITLAEFNESMVNEGSGEPAFTLKHEDGKYLFDGSFDTGESDDGGVAAPPATPEEESAEQMEALAEQMFKDAEFTVSVEFPGKVIDTNGVTDGNKVTWTARVTEPVVMSAVAQDKPVAEKPAPSDTTDDSAAPVTDEGDSSKSALALVILVIAGMWQLGIYDAKRRA